MLSRLSFNHKKSEKKAQYAQSHQTSQNNQKQNNQHNLNRVKKSLKLGELDPPIILKEKNFSTNTDNKLNLSLHFSSNPVIELKAKLSSRNNHKQTKKQIVVTKPKCQTITEQYYDLYGKDIIMSHQMKPIHKPQFLKNHHIDGQLRARMLDWMVEVTKSYKFINKSYFASVELMDRYFDASSQCIPVSQLHIIGVVCMYIASKMEQVYPLKIKTIYEKIVHKKINKEALIEMESKIFDTLDHKVNSWTFFDLALLKISDQLNHNDIQLKNRIEEVISFISKCIIYEYELYLRYDMETFAKVLVKIATKICDLPSKNEAYSVSCHEDIVKSYKRFKTSFKGLNNLFKFSDEKIINSVDSYFFDEKK